MNCWSPFGAPPPCGAERTGRETPYLSEVSCQGCRALIARALSEVPLPPERPFPRLQGEVVGAP